MKSIPNLWYLWSSHLFGNIKIWLSMEIVCVCACMYIKICIFKINNQRFYKRVKRICFTTDLAKSQDCSTTYSRLLCSWNIKHYLPETPLPKGGRQVLLSSFRTCLWLKTNFPSMTQDTCKHWELSAQAPCSMKSNTKGRSHLRQWFCTGIFW